MGTVGLSFGSPTSGAGFDVSSTVASIVSNLKNVETPWNTQLTQLKSQDTAISSFGTLLSNLSNDLSALTDVSSTAVMNLKTGSSSDNNVLELTGATSAAVAGTHTVVVTNLATTSSGYFAPVASATDKLSGSITLQVGSGTAQKISLPAAGGTLNDLKNAINASGVGISASVLTDSSGSRLSLVSGTSGSNGNITVSKNSIVDTTNHLNYTGSAGTSSTPSTGTLTSISNAGDTLSGSISIQVGNGAATSISITSTDNTLSKLADAINGVANIGVTASVVTGSDGTSSLQLVSKALDTAGNLTVNSSIVDTSTPASNALGYTSPPSAAGNDANLTVDGVNLTSSSNTVANLIPGVTFQLLAPSAKESDGSLEQIQVVIGNNDTGVESTVNTLVSDYNSLISAVNAQQGLDSSGNAEPLFGSPTLSLLQQQLLNGLNTQNPSGYLDPISSSASTALSGSFTVNVGNGTTQTIVIGSAPANPPADTFYTGSGSGYNTLAGLASAINAAASGTALTYSGTDGTDTVASSGTLTSLPDADDQLNGSISIQVGSGTAQNIVIGAAPASGAPDNTLYTGDGVNTLSGLADFINANLGVQAVVNTPPGGVSTLSLTSGTLGSAGTLTVNSSLVAAGIGFRASVVTNGGQSTLSLLSGTAGSSGVLTVNSQIAATSGTPLSYSGTAGSSTQTSIGTLTSIANATPVHTLAGSISIAVGSGQAQTITIDSTDNTLSGLADAINKASIGVQASVVTDPNNSSNSSLQLVSNTPGSAGTLAVTSNIADMTSAATATLSYTNSSDISTLANLGITVSNKYDGSISFDATMLSSALNSDYSSVLGFFQNVNSWGQTFSTMLESAGTSSSKGMLSLAQSSNSSIESVLNRDISNEESMISIQQKSLTAELNSANEILQMLPTQLEGVNQLYSAITGYNQNK